MFNLEIVKHLTVSAEKRWHSSTESKRLIFNFLPNKFIDELLVYIKKNPIVTAKGTLPLILRDQDSQETLNSNCNGQRLREDQIVRKRNDNDPTCLICIRPGEIIEKSSDTEVINNPYEDLYHLKLKDLFPSNVEYRQLFEDLLTDKISEGKIKFRDSQVQDKKWDILKSIYDLNIINSNPRESLLALLGWPSIGSENLDKNQIHRMTNVMKSISDSLEKHGISNSINDWKINSNGDTRTIEALDALKNHLFINNVDGPTFATGPTFFYCPMDLIKNGSQEIPKWWKTLNTSTWINIFQSGGSSDGSKIKINCLNSRKLDGLKLEIVENGEYPSLQIEGGQGQFKWSRNSGNGDELIEENGDIDLHDASVTDHLKPLIYSARQDDLSASKKLVSIGQFTHRILVDVPKADTVIFPSLKGSSLVSDVSLRSQGKYRVNIFHDLEVVIEKVIGKNITPETEGTDQEVNDVQKKSMI